MLFENIDKRDLYLVAFFSGLLLILCAIYSLFIIPSSPAVSNHSNLNSTILSLELLESVEEYNNLLGAYDSPKYQNYSDSFSKSIDIDNFFIFLYGVYFLALYEIGFRSNPFNKKISLGFYLIILLCIILDLLENYKIVNLLNSKTQDELKNTLESLRYISLSKWFFLFLCSGIIGVQFWLSREKILLKIVGLFLFTSFISSLPGLLRFNLLEIASYILYFGLFLSWIHIIIKNYYFLFLK